MARKPIQFLGWDIARSIMRATIPPWIEKPEPARWQRFDQTTRK